MGHVMRSLAIAQAWRRHRAPCAWALVDPAPAFEARLREEGIEAVRLDAERGSRDDARLLGELARARGAAWTVVDGYRFGRAYQDVLANAGVRAAWLDDRGLAGAKAAGLVVNPNLPSGPSGMPIAARTHASCWGRATRPCDASSPRARVPTAPTPRGPGAS